MFYTYSKTISKGGGKKFIIFKMTKFFALQINNYNKKVHNTFKFNSTTDIWYVQVLSLHIVGILTQFLFSVFFKHEDPLSFENFVSFYSFLMLAILFPFYIIVGNSFSVWLLASVKRGLFREHVGESFNFKAAYLKKYAENAEKNADLVAKQAKTLKQHAAIRKANSDLAIAKLKENIVEIRERNAGFKITTTPREEKFTLNKRLWAGRKDLDFKFLNEIKGILDKNSSAQGQSLASDFVSPISVEARSIFELYHSVMLVLLIIAVSLTVAAGMALIKYVIKLLNGNYKTVLEVETARAKKIRRLLWIKNIKWNEKQTLGTRFAWINFICDEKNFNRYFTTTIGSVYWVYYSKLEFVWTLIPCIILLFISLPSFTLALALDEAHKPAEWIKVVGNQWFWVYEYSTYQNNAVIFSNIVQGAELNERALRVLAVDNHITIRQNKFTRFLITSSDVIHSWAVPAMGIKVDACPGRINAVTVLPLRAGVYYGQCSEICGVNHGFMPICVEVVAG